MIDTFKGGDFKDVDFHSIDKSLAAVNQVRGPLDMNERQYLHRQQDRTMRTMSYLEL